MNCQPHNLLARRLHQTAVFCLTHAPKLYVGWTGEKVFKWLAFQLLTGGLVVVGSRDIEGVLIAWPDSAEEILRRERTGEFHFNWRRPMPMAEADALLIADVIVKSSAHFGKSEIVSRLVQKATARWPDWKLRRIFTHRSKPHGPDTLVELTPRLIKRFLAHVQALHT